MKKYVLLVITVLVLLIGKNVYAKDTVYSLNKYNEEELNYILKDPTGYVVAGTFNKGTSKNKDIQILLLKYRSNNTIEWKYSYGETQEDKLYGISYTYDENNNINGYLLVVEETTKEEKETSPTFLKIDLEGKLVTEKSCYLSPSTEITNIMENEFGYIISGQKDGVAFLAQYNQELDLVWLKTKEEYSSIEEMIQLGNNYYVVLSKIEEDTNYHVLKLDIEGNDIGPIKEDFEVNSKPHLEKGIDSYLIYGYTKEVKLSDNEIGSYYIIKYTKEDKEEWDIVGNTPVKEDKLLKVQTNIENDTIKDYYVLSTNNSDNSIEVIRISKDGLIGEKVKKLKNDYYGINGFLFDQDILYFIGQISCPEDDNCDYDGNSLYLVCTEDKVIEVQDTDSRIILIGTGILILGVLTLYGIRKKHLLTKKKH